MPRAKPIPSWGRLALILMLGASDVRGAECAPAVVLTGDATLLSELATLLQSNGVATRAAPDCPAAQAKLSLRDGEIDLDLSDGFGRSHSRTVSSTKTAAALIESWLTVSAAPENNAASTTIEPRPAELAPNAAPAPAPPPATRDAPVRGESEPTPAVVPARAAFLLEASVANDGSLWGAATLRGCVRLGPVCGGGLVRGAEDTRVSGDAPRHDSERIAADVLLTIGFPTQLGSATFSPGIGAGLNWVHITSRLPSKVEAGAIVDDDSASPALELFADLSWPIAQGLAFDVRLAAQAAPLSHTDTFFDEGVIVAGAPWGRVFGGFGLSYGTP